MKTFLIIIISFSFTLNILGQTFNWADTSFLIGSKRTIRPFWSPDNITRLQEDKNTLAVMDTLFRFLRKNPSLRIEIDCHLGEPSLFKKTNISVERAANIKAHLLWWGGIDTVGVIVKGYEFTRPIIPQATLDSLYRNIYRKNRKIGDTIERRRFYSAVHINERTDIIIINK